MEISRIQGPITPVKPVTLDEIRRRSEQEKLKEASAVDTSSAIRNQISTISDVVDEAPAIEADTVAMDMDLDFDIAEPITNAATANQSQTKTLGLTPEDVAKELMTSVLSQDENDTKIEDIDAYKENTDEVQVQKKALPDLTKLNKDELKALKEEQELKVKNLKSKFDIAKQELQTREKEYEVAKDRKEVVENNIEKKKQELENEQNELKDLKEEQKTVRENIDKLNSELEKAQKQQQVQAQKEYQAMMQKAMADYDPKVHGQDYQAYLAEKQASFSATPNPKVNSLSSSIKAANSDLAAIGSNIQTQYKNISNISSEIEDLGDTLENCNKQLNVAQGNLTVAKSDNSAAKTEYYSAVFDLNKIDNELKSREPEETQNGKNK